LTQGKSILGTSSKDHASSLAVKKYVMENYESSVTIGTSETSFKHQG